MPTSTRKAPKAEKKVLTGTVVPEGAKKPEDRKAKAQTEARTVEVRGRTWTIDPLALDDFELLDDLNALEQRGDASRLPSVLRRLLGDQWSEAMNVLRDKETRRVTVEAGAEFVADFMRALDPNSSGS